MLVIVVQVQDQVNIINIIVKMNVEPLVEEAHQLHHIISVQASSHGTVTAKQNAAV